MSEGVDLVAELSQRRVLAIVRGRDPDACVRAALTLVDEGISLVEVSMSEGDAVAVITRLVAEAPQALVGAGTVLTDDDVSRVREAGAAYVVTPALVPAVGAAVRAGLPCLAGAFTPTEAWEAKSRGAAAVKLFPASTLGPAHVRAMRAPFPDLPFVAVGGVGFNDIADYLESGCVAVGLGGPLLGDALDGGSLRDLRERARRALDAAAGARGGVPRSGRGS